MLNINLSKCARWVMETVKYLQSSYAISSAFIVYVMCFLVSSGKTRHIKIKKLVYLIEFSILLLEFSMMLFYVRSVGKVCNKISWKISNLIYTEICLIISLWYGLKKCKWVSECDYKMLNMWVQPLYLSA